MTPRVKSAFFMKIFNIVILCKRINLKPLCKIPTFLILVPSSGSIKNDTVFLKHETERIGWKQNIDLTNFHKFLCISARRKPLCKIFSGGNVCSHFVEVWENKIKQLSPWDFVLSQRQPPGWLSTESCNKIASQKTLCRHPRGLLTKFSLMIGSDYLETHQNEVAQTLKII